MTKQELKAKQAQSRAKNYLAITEQVTQLLEASLQINTESMRGNMYSDFWKFADRAGEIRNGINFIIADWIKQESEYDLKQWTFDLHAYSQQGQHETITG